VWSIDTANDPHPIVKPVDLVQKAIRNSSKSRGLIFDPFGGSGSALTLTLTRGPQLGWANGGGWRPPHINPRIEAIPPSLSNGPRTSSRVFDRIQSHERVGDPGEDRGLVIRIGHPFGHALAVEFPLAFQAKFRLAFHSDPW